MQGENILTNCAEFQSDAPFFKLGIGQNVGC